MAPADVFAHIAGFSKVRPLSRDLGGQTTEVALFRGILFGVWHGETWQFTMEQPSGDFSAFRNESSCQRVVSNGSRFSVSGFKSDLVTLCKGLAKLVIVDISLNRDQDNPQLIFASLNSTGRELSQADLIRNLILMGLEPDLQTRLYEYYWRPMEVDFGQEAYALHFDAFMRHYLTVKTGEIPNVYGVYQAFKDYAESREASGVEALVADIRVFAGYFCNMALGAERDSDLKMAFQDIRELKVDVAFPFLLELYHDYSTETLPKAELLQAVRFVESYVSRRVVCGIPTNSLNKTFATFGKALKKDRYFESIQANFLTLPSYRRFPNDEESRAMFKRGTSTTSVVAVTGCGDWKITVAKNARPWTSTRSSTSCPKTRNYQPNGKRRSVRSGNGFRRRTCTLWETSH
jgi:hypothetical protein